jgi:hypothetical protein
VQPALVLMLFQNFVQARFQFIHGNTHMSLRGILAQLIR